MSMWIQILYFEQAKMFWQNWSDLCSSNMGKLRQYVEWNWMNSTQLVSGRQKTQNFEVLTNERHYDMYSTSGVWLQASNESDSCYRQRHCDITQPLYKSTMPYILPMYSAVVIDFDIVDCDSMYNYYYINDL